MLSIIINLRRKAYCILFTFLELLVIKINILYELFMKCRKPAILNEIKRAEINSKQQILIIGCGIFPSTSIVIVDKIKTKITCIDNNPKAVKLARAYVKKMNLEKKIQIEIGEGISYPINNYDVIFVAINVFPINLVINHLAKNMKPKSKLICRGLKNDILNIENIDYHFNLDSKSEDPMLTFSRFPTTQSFLFIKK